MNEYEGHSSIDPGNEPPLITDGRRGPPDRREISARWLTGTFLTGITSSMLMGVALFAALDGREQLATPPELMGRNAMPAANNSDVAKGARVAATTPIQKNRDRRRLEVSTVFKDGERDVIRTMPFEFVHIALADVHNTNRRYPSFNPLDVFAEANEDTDPTPKTGLIYGAKVESEVSLRTVNFPLVSAQYDPSDDLSVDEVEEVVRNTGSLLTDGAIQVASLHYVDPLRFGTADDDPYNLRNPLAVKIIQENVSVAPRLPEDAESAGYSEELIQFRSDKDILAALNEAGYEEGDAAGMSEAIVKLLNSPRLKGGSVLRLGIESQNSTDRIMRASVYNGSTHILTIALNDRDQYVPADEPEMTPGLQIAFDDNPPAARRSEDLPTVYDGIYRAGIAYGMTDPMIKQLIRMLASDVDFQSQLSTTDQLEALFSLPADFGQGWRRIGDPLRCRKLWR